MEKPVLTKKMILFIAIGLTIAFVMALFLAIYIASTPADHADDVGIMNEENVFDVESVTEEDLEQQEQDKEEATADDLSNMDLKVQQTLSTGEYDELETYLSDLENTYRNSTDPAIALQMERVHGLRQDLAMITGINEENGATLLKTFSCPDTLASALLYLPLQDKYEAFTNLSSIAVPSIKEKESSQVRMKEKPYTEEESSKLLSDLNDRMDKNFVSIARYSATIDQKEVEVIVVQDGETAFWRPYTIRPADGDMDGFVSIQQAQFYADVLEVQNSLDQLDNLFSYTAEPDTSIMPDENDENFGGREPNT